jgi:outer membrane protein assembly factor BamB
VVNEGRVYFTCFDGVSFCLDAGNGSLVWRKQNSGTSAPIVAEGQVIVTQKETNGGTDYEGLKRIDAERGTEKDKKLLTSSKADYLASGKGANQGLGGKAFELDAAVGFANPPPSAKLGAASKQVGVNSVVGGWAYQGSRAAQAKGRVMNAQGKFLNSVRARDGLMTWQAEVKGATVADDSQVFSPPSLGERYMYLSSTQGHLAAVSQEDGVVKFLYSTKQPMTFQPALAEGNVYVGTANGLLICLKTGEKDADGWYAWGGNAQHNK